MHSRRLGVGVAVVNRLLFAIGGFDGKVRLTSMECYHPENNAWTILPSMSVGRSGSGVAALNQYIYVVGGFDGTRQLSSVERYDTENQIWDTVQSIKIARSALSLTVLDGKLYAMGGFDGQTFLSIVEVYDPDLDKWEEGTPLTSGRSGHASAVIYQPSCASAYMDCIEKHMNSEKRPPCPPDDPENSDRQNGNSSNAPSGVANSTRPGYSGNHCNHCTDQSSDCSPTDDSLLLPEAMSQPPSVLMPLPLLNAGGDVELLDDDDMSAVEIPPIDDQYSHSHEPMHLDIKREEPPDPGAVFVESLPAASTPPLNLSSHPLHFNVIPDLDTSTQHCDKHSIDNRKKCRRKCFTRCRTAKRSDSDNGTFATGGESSDSSQSNTRNQCAFSKFKNSFRQNLNGFVFGTAIQSTASGSTSTDTERKSCRFRKYYKSKMK